ncbi:unnamed protein product, partial [Sphenostylis stenocarpa]
FWVALRFQQLLFLRKFGRAASFEDLPVNSRLFVWAYHSDCLDNLFGSVIPNEPSWQEMRALGLGFWYANIPQLRARMEKLARAQYLKNKNPKDCALLYIALNRIQVLAGLFKISKDEKDKPLVGFLSRNFQDEKNKAAALKNAYVLLGRHQLELAVAFFLLGGDHSSAINVCAKNLGDEQLALVICRLVDGHGGPLEHHLITKYIIPSAIDKGDYWLASLLEWEMGNYYKSFYRMLEFSANPVPQESTVMSNCGPFLDPTVGFYCQMLATKNSMRNAVGEQNSVILLRWATLMTVSALKRCGNPLEALEYFSSSLSMPGTADQESELGDSHDVLSNTLKPLPRKCSNWLSANVSVHLEFHIKLNLALCYLSKLIKEHPSWFDTFAEYNEEASDSDECLMHYEKSVESFKQKLYRGLALFEQRFLLAPHCLISMILLFLCHHGSLYIGYDIPDGCTQGELYQKKSNIFDDFNLYYSRVTPLFKTVEEVSYFYSRLFCACSMENSQRYLIIDSKPNLLDTSRCRFDGVLISLWFLRATLRIQLSSISKDIIKTPLDILNFYEYYLHFSLAWLQKNSEALLYMVEPFLIAQSNGHNPYDIDMVNMKKLIAKVGQLLAQTTSLPSTQNLQLSEHAEDKLDADIKHSIPEDERWKILGTCLWQHMSRFIISNLNSILAKLEDGNLSGPFRRKYAYGESCIINMDSESLSLPEKIQIVSYSLCDLLMTTVTHTSSYHVKQHAEFLWQKVENDLNVMTLEWLKQKSQFSQNQNLNILELGNRKDYSVHQLLWDHITDPKLIFDCFAQEKLNWPSDLDHMHTKGWNDLSMIMTGLLKTDDTCGDECKLSTRSSNPEVETPVKGTSLNGHAFARSNQNDITSTNFTFFQSPREMYKRNGELLEDNLCTYQNDIVAIFEQALCMNSTNRWEAAVASNRKGIMFFHLEDEIPFSGKSDGLLWATADWPRNGWAGSESTPAPTCVSPGVGLGSKKGAHLGLGGATVGVGSSAWPSNDLTGGRVLGMLGYADIGASRLGWEIQQDFEDFVDPPATLENTSTRALSSHPMRPFFLVGSSNTHIYLWEFNKGKATATYGVLPAANVPPPYALASISAVQFDHFGHRFASAALDGTVCTWHLEVGGRSNVRPTESSLCFNGHASYVLSLSQLVVAIVEILIDNCTSADIRDIIHISLWWGRHFASFVTLCCGSSYVPEMNITRDVTYFSSSGSIIAVAGYSSNGVNVVIWDTLAPPTTSRASILCHEGLGELDRGVGGLGGGAQTISVSDNHVGSGSVSPLIVTGGKGGDVGVHDFRYIATGKTKRHRRGDNIGQGSVSSLARDKDQNVDGMLWYIPKAHSGSVTKVVTIPNTSLFLTGSTDGDVKLWDAQSTNLIQHWSKIHEKHTFLQPSSRGFGGVVRAAVTDIQVVSHGFLTCGGDGTVKLVRLDNHLRAP